MISSRDEMIKQNIGLVHSLCNKFTGKGIEYDDLFQAGCIGLIKSVDGFDESRGFKFSTYAVPAILGEIKRLFRDGGTVNVSRSIKEKGRKISAVRESFLNENNREPTVKELSEIMKLDEYEIAEAINASMPVMSLTYDDDENSEYDIPVTSPDVKISNSLALFQTIEALNEKDRQIIKLRYFEGLTQTVVAKKMNMTQVQVSRREKVILSQMRSKLL